MDENKKHSLEEAYHNFKQLCLFDYPIDQYDKFVTELIMGYGTHIDEKIQSPAELIALVKLQREQSVGLDMKFKGTPVYSKILGAGDSAIFVEEISIAMTVVGNEVNIPLRLSTVLEYIDKKWMVIHWHGSIAKGNEGDKDTWSANELQEKNKALEKKVAERTEELKFSLENLKATQKQLIQSEKMASLGELTAGIAHEIQNPLNFVNNFSEVSVDLLEEMEEEMALGNDAEVKSIKTDLKQNLEKIKHHGQRASGIVKGMLEHSRSGDGKKEPTDINTLADEYLRLAYHGLRAKDKSFNADFKTEFEESLPKINVVAQDIGRVILNLINNAFYAVAEKAKQEISGYVPTVTVKTKINHKFIEIRVKDNGNGIPTAVLNKIFQPFFTTKPTGLGTGLGLSLSYDIVTSGHQGKLEVDTMDGLGTEFIIELPI